jgi:protein involved in polysaccharide export with SLBB domain
MARRAELDSSAAYHERLARSTAYSESARSRAAAAAALARRRLTEGDFREGDRILLVTAGTVVVDDTITVLEGQRMNVPGFGPVSVAGVLRAELEAKLLVELSALVRNTTVTARPLMRVAVFGSVGAPGFLSVPQESTLDDLISRAGGPVATAAVQKITVTRDKKVILDMSEVMSAVAQGRTLSALGIEDGDAVMVPDLGVPWDRNSALQFISVITGMLFALGIINRR